MRTESPTVLIVEDDETYQCLLHDRLSERGFRIRMAKHAAEGLAYLKREAPEVLIVDLNLPDMPGAEVLEQAARLAPETVALVITGHASVESSLAALRLGAEDYLPKPINLEHLDLAVARGLERRRLRRENEELAFAAGKSTRCGELVGASKAMVEIYKEIARAGRTAATVLIQGETGTGKELAARAVHAMSERADKPFLALNCSSITESLLESELFGHVKGAFTGAHAEKPGYFEAAEGGTLLLDEIESAPPAVQAALLRVLDRHEVVRVGGREATPVDVRVIVTCNQDLDALVADGTFREDLYYRVLERAFTMPSLRERRDDIPLLAEHFIDAASPAAVARRRFSPKAMTALTRHAWPGNVRELRNVVTRLVADAPRPVIRPADLPDTLREKAAETSFTPLAELEREHVREALTRCHYNKSEAAQLLQISRSSLYALIRKHELVIPEIPASSD